MYDGGKGVFRRMSRCVYHSVKKPGRRRKTEGVIARRSGMKEQDDETDKEKEKKKRGVFLVGVIARNGGAHHAIDRWVGSRLLVS